MNSKRNPDNKKEYRVEKTWVELLISRRVMEQIGTNSRNNMNQRVINAMKRMR